MREQKCWPSCRTGMLDEFWYLCSVRKYSVFSETVLNGRKRSTEMLSRLQKAHTYEQAARTCTYKHSGVTKYGYIQHVRIYGISYDFRFILCSMFVWLPRESNRDSHPASPTGVINATRMDKIIYNYCIIKLR